MSWTKRFRDAWCIIGITILLFLVLELTAFIAAKIYNPYDKRADLPVYKDFKQRVEFWREHDKTWSNLEYAPYHLWTRPPFSGRWTNIDAKGDRVTHYNVDEKLSGVNKVFMFGGSTLWSTGATDWQTIPSFVAKFLNEKQTRSIVYNYGETSFVSTQGLNRLISEIKEGNVPDLVIFYSGINDASTAAFGLAALKGSSYHSHMDRFQAMFKASSRTHFAEIIKSSYILKAMRMLKNKFSLSDERIWAEKLSQKDKQGAIINTAKHWIANYRIASSIGKEYDFKVIFVLQPSLYSGKKVLQDYEKAMLQGESQPVMQAAYQQIRKDIENQAIQGIYDISDVFKQISDPIYIDWAHTGPLGNYYIAQHIAKIIESEGLLE